MSRHLPTVVWRFWRDDKHGSKHRWRNGQVRTIDRSTLELALFPADGMVVALDGEGDGIGLRLSRADARMVVRRLTQVLEDTS